MNHVYIIIALVISFLWGIQPIIHKELLKDFSSPTLMFLTGFAYLLCLSIFSYMNKETLLKEFNAINTKNIIMILFVSIITVFIVNIVYFKVLKNHEASIVSALIYTSPVFTLMVAHLLTHEELSKYGFIGIILITIGTMCVSAN